MTAELWVTLGVALLGLGVSLGTLYNARRQPARDSADAAESLSQAAAGLVEPLTKRIDALTEQQNRNVKEIECLQAGNVELRTEVAQLKTRLALYVSGVRRLIDQLRANGLHPVWVPPDDEP